MPQVINTNVASLMVQRNLNNSQADAATAMNRLSSGLRINSAKDDAAGLSIATRFTSQINGMNQAIRNAGDAVSLTQTAEAALGQVSDNLQRVRELAVQASNGTYDTTDRAAMQTEVAALLAEIDRVAEDTKFNGVKILDGSYSSTFQVGADNQDIIAVTSIADANIAALGSGSVSTGALSVDVSGISATNVAGVAGDLTINGTSIAALDAASSKAQRIDQIVQAVNAVSATTGVSVSYDASDDELDFVSDATGIKFDGATGLEAEQGFVEADADSGAGTPNNVTASAAGGVGNSSVASYTSSQTTIQLVDAALTDVNEARSSLGALQSRFESAVSSLQVAVESAAASRSRIMDADFAAETAAMTKNQILQQAGISVLSQANAQPQNVLALLQ